MPSKSKKQADFMAATSHDPEFAKKAGISQDVAKEFNKADQVNEEVLDEASGVGVLTVPPTLLKQVQKLVGSICLTLGFKKQKEFEAEGNTEEAKALNTFLKRYQRKYNASVLSDSDLKKYTNSLSTLKLNPEAIFNELPKNLQRPEVKDSLDNLNIKLYLSTQVQGIGGESQQVSDNLNIQTIKIPSYNEIENYFNVSSVIDSLNSSVLTVDHELQHAMQRSVLAKINSTMRQLERKPGYSDWENGKYTDYYSSGVEFGTQTKDLSNLVKNWLDDNNDKLTGDKKTDITNAIKEIMNSSYKNELITALKQKSQNKDVKKALKFIFKDVSHYYEERNLDDEGDLDTSEKDTFSDETSNNSKHLEHPVRGENVIGDLFMDLYDYYGEKPKSLGYYDDLKKIIFTRDYGEITFIPKSNVIQVHVDVNSDSSKDLSFEINQSDKNKLKQLVSNVSSLEDITWFKNHLDDMNRPNVNLEDTYYEVNRINDEEEFLNSDNNKSISFDFIEEESTIYINFSGARDNFYIQEYGKDYLLGYGDETSTCKSTEFEKVMRLLISFYYNSETTTRMINKTLRNVVQDKITPENVQSTINYNKELNLKRKEEPAMAESSMRSFMDIVQNAELNHDMDDAEEQTKINKGEKPLEEMPQRFDAFAGQDPDEFVDKTSSMNDKANMEMVSEHGTYKVYKSKNGTGYIAYDNNDNSVAVVSGYTSGGVFHEEAIAQKGSVKGIVYQIYMDMLRSGLQILSDTLHSDSAINFWKKIITNHEVYVVADGEILQRATPAKFEKYWGDEGSMSAELQLLLVK